MFCLIEVLPPSNVNLEAYLNKREQLEPRLNYVDF